MMKLVYFVYHYNRFFFLLVLEPKSDILYVFTNVFPNQTAKKSKKKISFKHHVQMNKYTICWYAFCKHFCRKHVFLNKLGNSMFHLPCPVVSMMKEFSFIYYVQNIFFHTLGWETFFIHFILLKKKTQSFTFSAILKDIH